MEQDHRSQLFEEFVSLLSLQELSEENNERLAFLGQNPQVIATLAENYWTNNIFFVTADEAKRKILEQDKYRIATKRLIQNHSGVAEPELRETLEKRFHFTKAEVEGLDHKTIAIIYFELIGLIRGSFNDEAIGSVFRRPLFAFGERSRIQLVEAGESEIVIEHAIAGLINQAA